MSSNINILYGEYNLVDYLYIIWREQCCSLFVLCEKLTFIQIAMEVKVEVSYEHLFTFSSYFIVTLSSSSLCISQKLYSEAIVDVILHLI